MEQSQELFIKVAETSQDIKYISKIINEIKDDLEANTTILANHESRISLVEEKQKDVIALKLDIKTIIAIIGIVVTLISLKVL